MRTLFISFILLLATSVSAATTIKDASFAKPGKIGKLTIKLDKPLRGYPNMKVHNSFIDVVIPNSEIKNEINKQYSFSSKIKDTNISIKRSGKNNVKAKVVLPFNIKKYENKVAMILDKNQIVLSFPRIKVKNPAPLKKKVVKKKAARKLDASFLDGLIAEEEKKVKPATVADKVQTKQAAVKKDEKKSFLMTYIAKFVAFLGVILLGFYGVVSIFKKGMAKKGKLGFLNKNEIVEVISNTYVGPKRSFMLVRAHEQVFLVSNTEQGMSLISEVNDINGLMKDGERKASGYNFDDKLEETPTESNVTLKEDIMVSKPISTKEAIKDYIAGSVKPVVENAVVEDVQERVKFSDQIKAKVKDLRPMQ
jgi:flagellar biogenesis protein FliO